MAAAKYVFGSDQPDGHDLEIEIDGNTSLLTDSGDISGPVLTQIPGWQRTHEPGSNERDIGFAKKSRRIHFWAIIEYAKAEFCATTQQFNYNLHGKPSVNRSDLFKFLEKGAFPVRMGVFKQTQGIPGVYCIRGYDA